MPNSVVIALGSNLSNRARNLRAAVHALRDCMRVVRVSSVHETAPVDAPPNSPDFLNMVVAGHTQLSPEVLLSCLQEIEQRLGRRRAARNGPRTIDLDIVLYGATVMRTTNLTLPHPRYFDRAFVRKPLAELRLGWRDPVRQVAV